MISSLVDKSGQYVAVPSSDETTGPTHGVRMEGQSPGNSPSWRSDCLHRDAGLPCRNTVRIQSRDNSRTPKIVDNNRRSTFSAAASRSSFTPARSEKNASNSRMALLCRLSCYTLALLCFLGTGVLIYAPLEGWSYEECIFFSVEVVTAVGWGSVVPKTDLGKLFTSAYALAAMIVMAFIVCQLMDFIIESALDDLLDWMEQQVAKTNTDSPWVNFRQRCTMLAVTATCGFFFFWKIDGMSPVDSAYFCVVSMTTIGFGDIIPKTAQGKVFLCIWIFVSVGCVASCMGAYTKASAARMQDIKINQQLNKQDMKAMDKNADGKVDRAEFLATVLIDSHLITTEQLSQINDAFDELDHDGSGWLDEADIKKTRTIHKTVKRVSEMPPRI